MDDYPQESAWARARRETKESVHSFSFWAGEIALTGAVGAAFGAEWAIAGPLFGLGFLFLMKAALAPTKQRNDARGDIGAMNDRFEALQREIDNEREQRRKESAMYGHLGALAQEGQRLLTNVRWLQFDASDRENLLVRFKEWSQRCQKIMDEHFGPPESREFRDMTSRSVSAPNLSKEDRDLAARIQQYIDALRSYIDYRL